MGKKKVRTLSDDQRKKLSALFTERLSAIQKDGSAPTKLTYENIGKSAKCTPLTAKRHWDKFLAEQGLRSKFGKVQKVKGTKTSDKGNHEAKTNPAFGPSTKRPETPTVNPADSNFRAWLQLGAGSGYVAKLVSELESRIGKALHGE